MTAPISNGPTTHGYTTMRDATITIPEHRQTHQSVSESKDERTPSTDRRSAHHSQGLAVDHLAATCWHISKTLNSHNEGSRHTAHPPEINRNNAQAHNMQTRHGITLHTRRQQNMNRKAPADNRRELHKQKSRTIRSDLLVGDTGIEPVTSSV